MAKNCCAAFCTECSECHLLAPNRFSLQCSHSLFAEMTCSLVVFTWVYEIWKYRPSEIFHSSLKYVQFFFKTSFLIDRDQNFVEHFFSIREINRSKTQNMAKYAILAHIFTRQIWSSGVSLKRSCKMLFRRVGLRSIGPSSQKLWPNQFFGRFPHCNYNVKLKMARQMSFMGL